MSSSFWDLWSPLPRWQILPGDPQPLQAWLRRKQAEDRTPAAVASPQSPDDPTSAEPRRAA